VQRQQGKARRGKAWVEQDSGTRWAREPRAGARRVRSALPTVLGAWEGGIDRSRPGARAGGVQRVQMQTQTQADADRRRPTPTQTQRGKSRYYLAGRVVTTVLEA
jgi:hypothetical protein